MKSPFYVVFTPQNRPQYRYLCGFSHDQIILSEDFHPLFMAVQPLKSSLGDLLQEEIFFPVVVNRFRSFCVVILAKVRPQSPPFCQPSSGYTVNKVVLVQSGVRELCAGFQSTQEAFTVQFVCFCLDDARCHLFSSDSMYF